MLLEMMGHVLWQLPEPMLEGKVCPVNLFVRFV